MRGLLVMAAVGVLLGVAAGKINFVQTSCMNNACSIGCTSDSFPVGKCVLTQGGASAIADACTTSGGLILRLYVYTEDCTGPFAKSDQPINVCSEDIDDGWFVNSCTNSSTSAPSTSNTTTPPTTVSPSTNSTLRDRRRMHIGVVDEAIRRFQAEVRARRTG